MKDSLKLIFSFFIVVCMSDVHAATVNVSTVAQLNNAIANANSGDVIKLSAGNYGDITIANKSFTSYVTLKSSNANNPAKLGNVDINNSAFVRLENFEIIGGGTEAVLIDESEDVEILSSDISGPEVSRTNPDPDNSVNMGVRATGVVRVRIENNTIHDAINATAVFGGNDVVLKENTCDFVIADCYKFSGVDGLLFENNFGALTVLRLEDTHVDFMQAQGEVSNGIFRGNVAIMGNASFQGLYFGGNNRDVSHKNNLIENNIIYNQHGNAIFFSDLSSGNTVRYNTVLNAPRDPVKNVAVHGDVVEYNVIVSKEQQSGIDGTNHKIHYEDESDSFHYDKYYKDLVKVPSLVTIEDFRPVSGSPAVSQVGAFRRIYELLGSSSGGSGGSGGSSNSNGTSIAPVISLLLD